MSYAPTPNPAQQYLRQKIEQASSVEQVIMLYDGILKFMTQAKDAIERGDIQARSNANRRAMEIVAYLLDMVNPATGGDPARALFGIYSGLIRRMLQIDFENSAAACEDIMANVRHLRTAMAQALAESQAHSAQAPQAPAAPSGNVVAAPAAGDNVPPNARRNAVA